LLSRKNWLSILAPFTLSRLIVLLIVFFVSQAHVIRHQAWEGEVISPHVELGSKEIKPALASIAMSGDARWYLQIAEFGYDFSNPEINKMRNWVFFPLVPFLIGLLSTITGSKILAGIILSNLSLLLCLRVLLEICREERMDDAQSERLLWLACFYPVSYFYSLPLTESVFALFLSSSFLFVRKRKYLLASCLLALGALTRPTGILILPAFALTLWLNSSLTLKNLLIFYIPAVIALLALFTFFYLNTGDPLAFIHNQKFWDRSGSVMTLLEKFRMNPGILLTGWNFTSLNVVTLLVATIAIFHFLKRKEWDYAAIIFLPVAAAINTGSVMSMARICMPLFPLLIFLSRTTQKSWSDRAVFLLFAVLLGIMTLLFALHVTSAMA